MTEDAERAQVLLAGMSDENRKSLEDLFFRQFPVISFQAVTPVPSTTVEIPAEAQVARDAIHMSVAPAVARKLRGEMRHGLLDLRTDFTL